MEFNLKILVYTIILNFDDNYQLIQICQHVRRTMMVTNMWLGPTFFWSYVLGNVVITILFCKYSKQIIYEVCPEGIQPCTMKNRDTRYKKHGTQDNDASVPFQVGTLGAHTVLPITISCPIVFSWISSMFWNLFLFKGDFSFGKSQKSQDTNSGL